MKSIIYTIKSEENRVTGKGYGAQSCPLGAPVVTYTYDSGTNAKGYLSSLTDQAGSGSHTHDIMGRMATETRSLIGANNAAISKNMSYGYDLAGFATTLTYPSGKIITRFCWSDALGCGQRQRHQLHNWRNLRAGWRHHGVRQRQRWCGSNYQRIRLQ